MENEESASEETESPGLDSDDESKFDCDTYRRMYGNPYLKAFRFRFVNSENKEEWVHESKWFRANWNKISSDEFYEGSVLAAQRATEIKIGYLRRKFSNL